MSANNYLVYDDIIPYSSVSHCSYTKVCFWKIGCRNRILIHIWSPQFDEFHQLLLQRPLSFFSFFPNETIFIYFGVTYSGAECHILHLYIKMHIFCFENIDLVDKRVLLRAKKLFLLQSLSFVCTIMCKCYFSGSQAFCHGHLCKKMT